MPLPVYTVRAGLETVSYPGVAQLVARVVWDHDAAGSNPVTRTTSEIIPHGKKTAIALAVAVFPSVLHVSSFSN